jgi:hypothetical protein
LALQLNSDPVALGRRYLELTWEDTHSCALFIAATGICILRYKEDEWVTWLRS